MPLRDFLEIPYDALEEMNLSLKQHRLARTPAHQMQEALMRYLTDERRIKAVTVAFSDLEGRLHMLDYDKKFLLRSQDNLTFDGSSVRGFSVQNESDLKLSIDWPAFYWLPADVFGPGKVLVFAEVQNRDGTPYEADLRANLKRYADERYAAEGLRFQVSPEIEGFLFQGRDAECNYVTEGPFKYVSEGGYYHSLPGDKLRTFIDSAAEVQRAMGFGNEKDHPEVAPSQFEMNFTYAEAVVVADQVQMYKLLCRQVAASLDCTASFLPKPVTGVNGSGMHTNMSLEKNGKNLFWDADGADRLSKMGWDAIERILATADETCLVFNPSVNAYRRLDPRFEAPNQIKASANNRSAMVRIPFGNEKSARVECRSVAPDVNPYMVFHVLMHAILDGPTNLPPVDESKRTRTRFLPDNIYDAIRLFKSSKYMGQVLGESVQAKYAEIKQGQADRCPKALGSMIKVPEIQFHHEVTNQYLWNLF